MGSRRGATLPVRGWSRRAGYGAGIARRPEPGGSAQVVPLAGVEREREDIQKERQGTATPTATGGKDTTEE